MEDAAGWLDVLPCFDLVFFGVAFSSNASDSFLAIPMLKKPICGAQLVTWNVSALLNLISSSSSPQIGSCRRVRWPCWNRL